MTVVVINDSMAVLRARLETDLARFSLTKFVHEMNASPHLQFWVWDGAGNKKKRQEVYPEYKAKRKPADPSIYAGMMLFKDLLKHTKGVSIEVPGYEADDVIATIVKKYAGRLPIVINTRDFDLRALCAEHPTVTCTVEQKPHAPDELIRLYKTWRGDPSDNIPGVKLFGEKAWEQANKAELQAYTDITLGFLASEKDDGFEAMAPWIQHEKWLNGRESTINEKHLRWIEGNMLKFRAMWNIIGFYDVPNDLMTKHTVTGVPNLSAADALLKEYFL